MNRYILLLTNGSGSIKDFKAREAVNIIPLCDTHLCRYVAYWQK